MTLELVVCREVKESIPRCFADDTRIRRMIGLEENLEKMQKNLDIICEWAKENLTKLNKEKSKQRSHGMINNIVLTLYKSSTSKETVDIKKKLKVLGVTMNRKL